MSESRAIPQYTVRGVPPEVDRALREKCRREHRSLNDVVIETLRSAVLPPGEIVERHDLDDLAGTWEEAPEFDEAIEEQSRVDEDAWR